MEPWRQRLEQGFHSLNKKAQNTVKDISHSLRDTMSEVECEQCKLKCLEADMLILPCKHAQCIDCVVDQLERLVGYFERNQPDCALRFAKVLKHILVCSRCHQVCVTQTRRAFSNTLHSKDGRTQGREIYEVDTALTEVLSRGSAVEQCFQNERRTLLGKFSARSLFPFERRPFTNHKNEAFDMQGIDVLLSQKNKLWVEDWTFDKSSGNPQGWYYAFNWPSGWEHQPSAATFVRRRLLMRASIANDSLEELTKRKTAFSAE